MRSDMKKFICLFLCVAGFAAPSFAALPPIYQSLKELQMLVQDPRLAQQFKPGEMITCIQKDGDHFVVSSKQSEVIVGIVYEQLEQPGPARFHFDFPKSK
jgi:hypothetical protein